MSEAELHVLRARLIGGQLNKARRGELWIRPPLGMVFDTGGKLMRYFREQQLVWPRRVVKGPRAGALVFGELERDRVLAILHNPRYAGAYVYGRTRQRKVRPAGQARYRRLPRDEWKVFLPDATLGTSPGSNSKRIRRRCVQAPRASAQTAGAARRAKAWPCCRGSSSAVGAAAA